MLAVPDRVAAERLGIEPAAFRKRLSRARRVVRAHVASASGVGPAGVPARRAPERSDLGVEARALDRLVALGEMHAARGTWRAVRPARSPAPGAG